jgi:hypothetical protein
MTLVFRAKFSANGFKCSKAVHIYYASTMLFQSQLFYCTDFAAIIY